VRAQHHGSFQGLTSAWRCIYEVLKACRASVPGGIDPADQGRYAECALGIEPAVAHETYGCTIPVTGSLVSCQLLLRAAGPRQLRSKEDCWRKPRLPRSKGWSSDGSDA
jgi:hypothetical protein